MNMIEKVARHIFSTNTGTQYYEVYHPAFEYEQEHWETLARAAIEAMRSPTLEMIAAGLNSKSWSEGEDRWDRTLSGTYTAMIDAALEGGDAQ